MGNQKITREIMDEILKIGSIHYSLSVITPEGESIVPDLPASFDEMREYIIYGLIWGVERLSKSNARNFLRLYRESFERMVMQQSANCLTTCTEYLDQRMSLLFIHFIFGLEIVFQFLDNYDSDASKLLNQMPYEAAFAQKYVTDYPEESFDKFYSWYNNL